MILLKRRAPVNLKPEHLHLFKHELTKEIQGPEVVPVKNAFVLHDGVCYQKFHPIKESLVDPAIMTQYNKFYFFRKLLNFKYEKLPGSIRYVLAFDSWSFGYFHWMTDTLQRFYAANDFFDDAVFLLPDHFHQPYHASSLEILGIKNIKWLKKGRIYFSENLLLSQHMAFTGNNYPEYIRKLSALFINTAERNFSLGDKIYISRSKAPRRKILNEEEIENLLSGYGFKIVYFEDYSFKEQISIAHHAKHLISIHGAGLTNMMFMKPEGCVLELRREHDPQNNCYFTLASDAGLNYYYQVCLSSDLNLSTQNDDVNVDTELLKKNVEMMLSSSIKF